MKKSLTLFLVIVALAIFTCPGVAQRRTLQTSPPVGVETQRTTIKTSKSNSSELVATGNASPGQLKGTVTEVNNRAQTFTVAVIFSAASLSTLPTVGESIDLTYTETPGGGPMEATTIKSSKSNSSDRAATSNVYASAWPGVAQQQNATQNPPAGVETQRTTIKGSKSNGSERMAIKGSKSNQNERVATNNGYVFAGPGVEQPQQATQNPPAGVEAKATTIKGSKSNSSERMATDNAAPKLLAGKVTEVNNQAKTFTVAIVFSAANLSQLPSVGDVIDFTYTDSPDGGPRPASNLNLSKSNID